MKRPFLSAEWRHLAMLNYEVDAALLRPLVPPGTEIDFWNGKTYLSVVGFHYLRTRVLGFPVPFHRNFDEINLRFYVRRQVSGGWRRGVVFVKEYVRRSAVALVARWAYHENFVACPMGSQIQLPDPKHNQPGAVEYRWAAQSRWNAIGVAFEGLPSYPAAGSEEEFITEHYWGYVVKRSGHTREYNVEHPRWRVWPASSAQLDCDVQGCYGPQYCAALSQHPSSAFVAEGSAVAILWGTQLPVSCAESPIPAPQATGRK